LGNVKVVFNDYKEPVSGGSGSEKYDLNVLSLLNYYPFGMSMPGIFIKWLMFWCWEVYLFR